MASRRRYKRRNPDPNPPAIVDNPNTISKGIKGSYSKSGTPSHLRDLSFEILRNPEDNKFDDKIQEVLFRSENENELTEIVIDLQRRGIDTSALLTKKEREEFWEVVTSELLLEREYFDKIKELDPYEFLLRRKSGIPLPD